MSKKEMRAKIKEAEIKKTFQKETVDFFKSDPIYYQYLSSSGEAFVDGVFVGYKFAQEEIERLRGDLSKAVDLLECASAEPEWSDACYEFLSYQGAKR